MTVAETAEMLNVRSSWVAGKVREGAIPSCRLGRHVRIPRQELIDWAEALVTNEPGPGTS